MDYRKTERGFGRAGGRRGVKQEWSDMAPIIAERDALRARLAVLESPPVVPEGWEVRHVDHEVDHGEYEPRWELWVRDADGEPIVVAYIDEHGELFSPGGSASMAALEALFYAHRTGQRPPHGGGRHMSTREIDPVDIDPELSAALESAEAKRRSDAYDRELRWQRERDRERFAAWEAEQNRLTAAQEAARAITAERAKSARAATLATQQRRITRAVLPPAAAAWALCLLCAVAAIAGWP